MNKQDSRNLALYGQCWCGAPRQSHHVVETDHRGHTNEYRFLTCSKGHGLTSSDPPVYTATTSAEATSAKD